MKALHRLKYLLSEGFYLFAFTYSKPKQKIWIEYSFNKTLSSKNTIEEEFENISEEEYETCKEIYYSQIVIKDS